MKVGYPATKPSVSCVLPWYSTQTPKRFMESVNNGAKEIIVGLSQLFAVESPVEVMSVSAQRTLVVGYPAVVKLIIFTMIVSAVPELFS